MIEYITILERSVVTFALLTVAVAPWLLFWRLTQIERHLTFIIWAEYDDEDPDPGEELPAERRENVVDLARKRPVNPGSVESNGAAFNNRRIT